MPKCTQSAKQNFHKPMITLSQRKFRASDIRKRNDDENSDHCTCLAALYLEPYTVSCGILLWWPQTLSLVMLQQMKSMPETKHTLSTPYGLLT